jgi:hypothetical protein
VSSLFTHLPRPTTSPLDDLLFNRLPFTLPTVTARSTVAAASLTNHSSTFNQSQVATASDHVTIATIEPTNERVADESHGKNNEVELREMLQKMSEHGKPITLDSYTSRTSVDDIGSAARLPNQSGTAVPKNSRKCGRLMNCE